MTALARLDPSRDAKPLTMLTAPIMGRTTLYAGPATWLVDCTTGRRTMLVDVSTKDGSPAAPSLASGAALPPVLP